MASSKDTFESKTFAANSFASGVFRGLGVDIELPELAVELFVTSSLSAIAGTSTSANTVHFVQTSESSTTNRIGVGP